MSAVTADELKDRTRRFALDVIDLCVRLGSDDFAHVVRRQLLKSGTGVASNYRAAGRSRSRQEFASRLAVVVEEADESELWLDILRERQCGDAEKVERLRREAVELRAIFAASRATTMRRQRREG